MATKLRVVPKPATPDGQPSESEKLDSKGLFYRLNDDIDNALEVFQKALEIREADYLDDSSLENLKDISVSCNRLASVHLKMGQLIKASHFFSKSLKIDETLVQKNPSLQNRRDLAKDWIRISDLFKAMGKLEKASKACRIAIQMSKALIDEAPIRQNRQALVYSYLGAVDILTEQGQPQKAAKFCTAAIHISEDLIREDPALEDRHLMHLLLGRMGNVFKEQQMFEEAEEYYQKAVTVLSGLSEEYDLNLFLRDRAVLFSWLSEVSQKQGKLEAAANFCLKAIKIKLAQENPTLENRRDLAIGWKQMASLVKLQENNEMALKYYQKSLNIATTLVRESPTLQHQQDLGTLCFLLGGTLCDLGKFQNALPLHHKGLNIVERVVREAPSPQNRFCCYLAHESLGMTCAGLLNLDQALENFKNGLEILEALIREFPEFKYIYCYSGLLAMTAVVLNKHVSAEAAQAFHNKSLVISKLNPKDPGILTAPNADDLNDVLAKTRQRAADLKPDLPPVVLERHKEVQRYASIFSAFKESVTLALDKTEN